MTEPEYRFVKGHGWVPTLPAKQKQRITINEAELQVGDTVINWIYADGHVRSGIGTQIVRIDLDGWVYTNYTKEGHPAHRIGCRGRNHVEFIKFVEVER